MLAARVATSVVGLPILALLIWLGGPVFAIAAALFAALAAREAFALTRSFHPPDGSRDKLWLESQRELLSLLAVASAAALALSALGGSNLVVAVAGLIVFAHLALPLFVAEPKAASWEWPASLAASVYAGLPLALLVLLREQPGPAVAVLGLSVVLPAGAVWALVTFTTVWAVDTLAFVVGRLAGRRPLWPRVSPKKTIEGTTGGVIAGILVGFAWAPLLGFAPLGGIALGAAVAASAILGDLFESALKRAAGVKDSGQLLPGHGGLLDRLDSVAFAAVVVFLIRVSTH